MLPEILGVDLVPLGFALVLSGLVGFEREWSGRPAGLRTHVLVCLSSTMLIMLSQQVGLDEASGGLPQTVFDPNRMSAGIVTGIGFLGAATVLRSGDLLRGLTTAACIWFVAALGIVLGNERYELAVAVTAIVLFVLTLLNRVTNVMSAVVYRSVIVSQSEATGEPILDSVRTILQEHGCRVVDVGSTRDLERGLHDLELQVVLENRFQAPVVTEAIVALPNVKAVRWKLISVP